MTEKNELAGAAALLGASAIWGASFVLAKLAFHELTVPHVLLYRFIFAVLPFLPILLARGARPERRDLWLFALTGFLMVPVTFLLQFGGLMLTSATSTALLIGTGAPLLALAAVLFEGEHLGKRGWVAVAVSCLGVLMLVGAPGAKGDWRGDLMVLGSMLIATVWVIMSKRLVGRYRALHATGWILLFGTLFLIPISLFWSGLPPVDISATTWASLLALGLGCTTLAYVLWNWGVANAGAARAGVYLNLEPIVGALMGILLMGDPLSVGVVAGGALIVVAAGIVSGDKAEPIPVRASKTTTPPWWQSACPSVHAEFAIRLYGGRPRELTSSGGETADNKTISTAIPCRTDAERRSWRPDEAQPATACRVSFW